MRLFVALDLPGDVRQALGELIARLKPHCEKARWARMEAMHVTLKFIGHVDAEKLDPIRAALATSQSSAPVEIQFRGVGFFPNAHRPRVVWCGVQGSANLAPLAAEIERALEPLGIAAEGREFVPHLTLARFNSSRPGKLGRSPDGIEALVHAAKGLEGRDFGSARETEFHLYESITKPTGAEYRKIESYSFTKGAA